jgi:hypothetical protein
MDKLFKLDFLKQFKYFELWSDNAPHFKNQYLMHYYYNLAQCSNIKSLKTQFFVENHGKSDCDQFFGTLSRWYRDFLTYSDDPLTCAKDLANFFDGKEPDPPKKPTSVIYSFKNIVLDKYLLKESRNLLKMSGICSYYSFYFDTEKEKIKADYFPSRTKIKHDFEFELLEQKKFPKKNSTGYPNTNEGIQVIDEIILSQSTIKSITERYGSLGLG